jgi:hypothetical protein
VTWPASIPLPSTAPLRVESVRGEAWAEHQECARTRKPTRDWLAPPREAAALMPERVETSLLVVEDFTDANGFEWRAGDRAPLARSGVRRAATERPGLFRVEWGTEPLNPAEPWFEEVVHHYEALYMEAKRQRDGAEQRRQQAIREELKEQERGQPELERRYREQEREREKRAQRAREAFERERIERELEHSLGPPGSNG